MKKFALIVLLAFRFLLPVQAQFYGIEKPAYEIGYVMKYDYPTDLDKNKVIVTRDFDYVKDVFQSRTNCDINVDRVFHSTNTLLFQNDFIEFSIERVIVYETRSGKRLKYKSIKPKHLIPYYETDKIRK